MCLNKVKIKAVFDFARFLNELDTLRKDIIMPPVFNLEQCSQCSICIEDCPGYILEMTENGPSVMYPDECWHCGNCRISCPQECISYEFPISMLV